MSRRKTTRYSTLGCCIDHANKQVSIKYTNGHWTPALSKPYQLRNTKTPMRRKNTRLLTLENETSIRIRKSLVRGQQKSESEVTHSGYKQRAH